MDWFAPGFAPAAVLLALRVGGLVLVAPMFSARTIPATLRTTLTLVLTVLLAPVAHVAVGRVGGPAATAALAITPATFLAELLVGIALGLGAALLVAAVELAGDLATTTTGLSGASLLDPLSGQSSTVLTQLAQMFALTVVLALDGHLVMLDALAESVRTVPVGAGVDLRAGLDALVRSGATLFALGLRFAAPVLAATLIGNVALAVLTRAAPQLNVLTLAFPLQIAIGLVAFAAALVSVGTWLTGWSGSYAEMLEPVVGALLRR